MTVSSLCEFPYSAATNCTQTFATELGSVYSALNILFAIAVTLLISFSSLCFIKILHLKNAPVPEVVLSSVSFPVITLSFITSIILLFRCIDFLGWNGWLPLVFIQFCYDVGGSCILTVIIIQANAWLRFLNTASLTNRSATRRRQKFMFIAAFAICWLSLIPGGILSVTVGTYWAWHTYKMVGFSIAIIFTFVMAQVSGYRIHTILMEAEAKFGVKSNKTIGSKVENDNVNNNNNNNNNNNGKNNTNNNKENLSEGNSGTGTDTGTGTGTEQGRNSNNNNNRTRDATEDSMDGAIDITTNNNNNNKNANNTNGNQNTKASITSATHPTSVSIKMSQRSGKTGDQDLGGDGAGAGAGAGVGAGEGGRSKKGITSKRRTVAIRRIYNRVVIATVCELIVIAAIIYNISYVWDAGFDWGNRVLPYEANVIILLNQGCYDAIHVGCLIVILGFYHPFRAGVKTNPASRRESSMNSNNSSSAQHNIAIDIPKPETEKKLNDEIK